VQIGVVDLDAGRRRDVGSRDRARALLAQVHDDGLVVLRGDDEALDVEDDLGDVFLAARNRLRTRAGHRRRGCEVTAAPGMLDRSVRRMELPRV
jgi:hypothetical protein